MRAYKHVWRSKDYVSQSFVIRGGPEHIAVYPWSLQVARTKSRFGDTEKRGFQVWISGGPIRLQVGSR
jgi:hypothetical protein